MSGLQNEETLSSFRYAKRVQAALLPKEKDLKRLLGSYFLIYKPMHIIGGDFYWTAKKKEHILLSVADCTGHGITGALITMLGINALNEIVKHQEEYQPNIILNKMRSLIVGELNESDNLSHFDGIDISLCSIHPESRTLKVSGANNQILLVRQKEMIEIKGNNMPLGPYWDEKDFTLRQVEYQPGDIIYLFTDGYKDQFGDKIDKKFGKKRFKDLIRDIRNQDLPDQKQSLEENFQQWKGNKEQVDDLTVMAVKL
jgi:serine phosphatase RsbU (regulator of sigma subunit)